MQEDIHWLNGCHVPQHDVNLQMTKFCNVQEGLLRIQPLFDQKLNVCNTSIDEDSCRSRVTI